MGKFNGQRRSRDKMWNLLRKHLCNEIRKLDEDKLLNKLVGDHSCYSIKHGELLARLEAYWDILDKMNSLDGNGEQTAKLLLSYNELKALEKELC
jgi:hypothetical protein